MQHLDGSGAWPFYIQQDVTYVGHLNVAILNIQEGKMKFW
jgi:hypothetical protein